MVTAAWSLDQKSPGHDSGPNVAGVTLFCCSTDTVVACAAVKAGGIARATFIFKAEVGTLGEASQRDWFSPFVGQ